MDLDLVRIFVKVAQNASFTKAAEVLNLPKSTVSKVVSRLENETGTKLILRTTRSLTLTAAGRAFYEASLGPIQALEDAQKSLYGQDSLIAGSLKITAPEDIGYLKVAPAVAELAIKHPALRFDLNYTNEIVDLVKDGFDLAVRIGKLNESSFKFKKAGEIILYAVASPAYLKNHPKIKNPKDLENHRCISLGNQSVINRWTLRSGKNVAHMNIKPIITSNQMTSLLNMAIAGAGVALLPQYLCQDEIDNGKLVRVLPDWVSPGLPLYLVAPLSFSSSARLKITAEYLLSALEKALAID